MPSNWWKLCVAELIATFALIFIGAGSIMADAIVNPPSVHRGVANLAAIALAHGLTIAVMVSATGRISGGHINPAVTLAFLATRRMPPALGAAYVVSQLLGAAIGGLLLTVVFPADVQSAVRLGTPVLNEGAGVTPLIGIVVEAVLTLFLAFVIWGTAVDDLGPRTIGGLGIGLTVALDMMMGAPLTGGAMNPARTFGPAIASGTWDAHYVYWIGPIIGAVVAALVYEHLYLRPAAAVEATT